MPTIAAYPSYVAGTNGLLANYSLSFSGDNIIVIPLEGMHQGDRVYAQSIYISNLASTQTLQYSMTGGGGFIPPYSDGYIDIRGQGSIQITSPAAASINVQVMNYPVQYGFVQRGNAPSSLTNDPYWNRVSFLSHFEGQEGGQSAFDNKSLTSKSLSAPLIISKNYSKFGSSSIYNPNWISNVGSVIGNGFVCAAPYSFEFFYRPGPNNLTDTWKNIISLNDAGANHVSFFVNCNSNGNLYLGVYESVTPSLAYNINSDGILTPNDFNYISLNVNNTGDCSLYLNGKFIFNGTINGAGGNRASISSVSVLGYLKAMGNIDEMRLTSFPRFLSESPVPTTQFLDQ